MEITKYTVKQYAAMQKIAYRTAWRWIKNGLVKTEILPSGRTVIIEEKE